MRFSELIDQLSHLLDVPLQPENETACSILVDNKWTLQMEMDQRNNRLLISSYICVVPPGKFRENVLLQTLKANALAVRIGTFGFLESSGELIFFHFLCTQEWEIEKVSNFLKEFIYVTNLWIEAIAGGRAAPSEFFSTPHIQDSSKPFGLKP